MKCWAPLVPAEAMAGPSAFTFSGDTLYPVSSCGNEISASRALGVF